MVEAVKRGYPQQEIADAAFELQQRIDTGERLVIGVNSHVVRRRGADPDAADRPRRSSSAQIGRLEAVRARRDGAAVQASLARLREVAATSANVMEALLDATRAHASEGEIVQRAPGRLGPLHRDARVLNAPGSPRPPVGRSAGTPRDAGRSASSAAAVPRDRERPGEAVAAALTDGVTV